MPNSDVTIPTLKQLRKRAPILASALDALVRGDASSLEGCLVSHRQNIALKHTNAVAHIIHLALEGNNRLVTPILAEIVARSIIEYAIPRTTAQEAYRKLEKTGHAGEIIRIHKQATDLFVDLDKTGEGGEMFLFALAEQVLGIPQVLSKMSLKTSRQMHFHGSDGIHAKIDPASNHLQLYFCESKMYTDLNTGLNACFSSAAPFLLEPPVQGSPARHEIYLVSEFNKIGDPELAAQLIEATKPGTIAAQSTEYCLAVLVGFDATVYPPDVDATLEAIDEAVTSQCDSWLDKGTKSVLQHKLDPFRIIVFFVPFDSVQNFRDYFLRAVGVRHED